MVMLIFISLGGSREEIGMHGRMMPLPCRFTMCVGVRRVMMQHGQKQYRKKQEKNTDTPGG